MCHIVQLCILMYYLEDAFGYNSTEVSQDLPSTVNERVDDEDLPNIEVCYNTNVYPNTM